MNASQLVNIILKVLTFIAGIAAAHGLAKYFTWVTNQEFIGILTLAVTALLSHFMHSSPPANNATPPAGTITRGGSLLSVLLLTGFCALMFTGCAGVSANTYKAETLTDTTVSTALHVWGDYVAANHPPVTEELQVKALFEKIQAAELVIESTHELYLQNTGNTNLLTSISISTATEVQEYNDLLALLRSFGVKI